MTRVLGNLGTICQPITGKSPIRSDSNSILIWQLQSERSWRPVRVSDVFTITTVTVSSIKRTRIISVPASSVFSCGINLSD